jgi:hypothetical protein
MIYTFDYIKAEAKRLRRRVDDLIVLSPNRDPFYCGRPSHKKNAKWFASIWNQFGYTTGVHLRRIHYQIISQKTPMMLPSGMGYENTEECWDLLGDASQAARYLELVDPDAFDDRRNPETIIKVPSQGLEPSVRVGSGYLGELPELPLFPALPNYRLENYDGQQRYMLEIWCEKSTVNDVLIPLCNRYGANLQTGLGELSITKCRAIIRRIRIVGKPTLIFYIMDFDPGGQSMPVSVARKIEFYIRKMTGQADVKLVPVVLTLDQVQGYSLPRTPIKDTELRKAKFEGRYGEGAVELDALEALYPGELERILSQAMDSYFDKGLDERVRGARRGITSELSAIRDEVYAQLGEETERLRKEWEAIREEFAQRVETLNKDISTHLGQIAEELEERMPDPKDYPIPEAAEAEETVDALYDSRRDYLEQLDVYKQFQGRPGNKQKKTA